MRDLTVRPFLLCLSLCLAPAALHAQAQPGADVIAGRITDLAGRPVPDAQVAVTSLGSGLTRTHTTDADGRYKVFFPETAPQYVVSVKRMGFHPVQRTIKRHSKEPQQITVDVQFGGTPLALSMVEIAAESDAPGPREPETVASVDAAVPNPVAEIIALKDTLHLSAVQMIGLGDVSDTLQAKNTRIYRNIRTLLAKSQEAGDVTQMAGTVAMMLEEASRNTAQAVVAAEKLLRPEQWLILPPGIMDRPETKEISAEKQ